MADPFRSQRPERRIITSATLHPHVVEWLKQQAKSEKSSVSRVLENLARRAMQEGVQHGTR